MGYRVIVSESADEDLDAILAYMIEKLENPTAAIHFADEVDKIYDNLSRHPEMFGFSLDERLAEKGYRRVAIGNFVMLYRVEEGEMQAEKRVLITRFFYGKRDYGQYI